MRDASRPGSEDVTEMALFSTLRSTVEGIGRESFPFGPWTSSAPLLSAAVTPLGIAIGRLPTRDCMKRDAAGAPLAFAVAVAAVLITRPHKGAPRRLAAGALLDRSSRRATC